MAGRAEKVTWRRIQLRNVDGLELDPDAYPRIKHITFNPPKPDWACIKPDLQVHPDGRIARIDVKVLEPPENNGFQIGWMPYLKLLRRDWLEGIADLVDGQRIALGEISVKGEILPDWVTLHGVNTPILLSDDCHVSVCRHCGERSSYLVGRRCFFADPAVVDMPLIVNSNGIFIREDEYQARGLDRPIGAWRPSQVAYRPDLGEKLWPPLSKVQLGARGKHLRLREKGPPKWFDPFGWII